MMNTKIVTIKEYAEAHKKSYASVYWQIKHNRFETAEIIDKHWYLDPDEPYPIRQMSELSGGEKVLVAKYAEIHKKTPQAIYEMLRRNRLETAKKIKGRWYIDPKEPYPVRKPRPRIPNELPNGKVRLNEYAARNNKKVSAILQMLYRGRFQTAVKIDGHWYLNPDEPYPTRLKTVPAGKGVKVGLREYAEKHIKSYVTVSRLLRKKRFATAEKIGGRWYIDPNEPYPKKQRVTLAGKIGVQEYAARHKKSYAAVIKLVHKERFVSAEKIDGRWYIDPNEPYSMQVEIPSANKIRTKEYAERNHKNAFTVRAMMVRGRFKSAEKMNGRWYIDPNEPYPDRYPRNSRLKLTKAEHIKNATLKELAMELCNSKWKPGEEKECEAWLSQPDDKIPEQEK